MTIKAIETAYKGYRFRSRLEARWAVFFDALGIQWEYEVEGYDLGDEGWYLPDFWLPEQEYWFECKPEEPMPMDFGGVKKYAVLAQETKHHVIIAGGTPRLKPIDDSAVTYHIGNLSWVWPGSMNANEFWVGLQWVKHPRLGYRVGDFFGDCIESAFQESGHKAWDSEPYHFRLLDAYKVACSARFEHGEMPTIIRNYEPTDREVEECLNRHGYAGSKYKRMCPPGKPNEGSVIVLSGANVAFHFSPDDPMRRPDGQGGVYPVTPFDVLATYECDGNYAAAVRLAKKRLGRTP